MAHCSRAMNQKIASPLDDTEFWVFDLDNTLYPADCDLFSQIDVKMGAFISAHCGIDRIDARKLQKRYYREHGTTLAGLMANGLFDAMARSQEATGCVESCASRRVLARSSPVTHV